jgi:hypothetical protein
MSSEEKSDLVLSLRSVTAPTSWLVRSYNLVQILTFDVTTRGLTSILMTEGLLCRIRTSIIIHVMVSPILVSSNRHAESPRKRSGLEGTAHLLGMKLTRRAKPSAYASSQPMQHRLR